MKTQYFIFGVKISQLTVDGTFEEVLELAKTEHDFALYKHTPDKNVIELLEAYDGWGSYAILSEDEYKQLLAIE